MLFSGESELHSTQIVIQTFLVISVLLHCIMRADSLIFKFKSIAARKRPALVFYSSTTLYNTLFMEWHYNMHAPCAFK